jgi:hypothetical protein
MIQVEHSLKFVTSFDEEHPVVKKFLATPESFRVVMLESMLKELVAPRLKPILDELNENSSYAYLSVAE